MAQQLTYKLIDGNQAYAKNVITRCHSTLHPGYITGSLLKSHSCIVKECPHLEKTNLAYWFARDNQLKP